MPADDLLGRRPLTFAQRAVLRFLRAYQLLFSPMFAGSCRFVPSCSTYAVEAVERFGVARGSWLALSRLSRCRPFAAHGFDPVPPAAAVKPPCWGAVPRATPQD